MPRRSLILVATAAGAIAVAGCGSQSANTTTAVRADAASRVASVASAYRAHPQAVEPVAGDTPATTDSAPETAGVSVGGPASGSLPQPESISTVRQDLTLSGMTASPNQATLTPDGLAIAPIDAPAAVQAVIAAGNEIAHLPYVWGGGHLTYEDTGYDCSGSISYVFAAAHLLDHTVVSGQLESFGDPGPGKWITVFANAGHTFMYVAGLRFDTVALAQGGSRWSDRSAPEDLSTFSVRHPVGL